jgi:hypothetical protein
MHLRPGDLQFVLAQGLPAVVEVRGTSMMPAFAVGDRLNVEPAAIRTGEPDLEVGDIVLVIAADAAELVVHRVMHVFSEGGRRFVAHQGDMPGSSFAICGRAAVIGKVTGFEADAARPLPTVERMTAAERARFRRRAAACALYCRARRLAGSLRLRDRKLTRAAAALYRRLTRALGG